MYLPGVARDINWWIAVDDIAHDILVDCRMMIIINIILCSYGGCDAARAIFHEKYHSIN